MKVSHKARHGRKCNPTPHKSHRKATAYSRHSRRLKRRLALMFAPTIADGLSELEARHELRPRTTGLVAASTTEAPARVTAAGRVIGR